MSVPPTAFLPPLPPARVILSPDRADLRGGHLLACAGHRVRQVSLTR